jgi:hypothetical protein
MDEADGRVAVLLPHGVLFRGGAEEDIRKYLIKDLNRLDAVIGLPANLFHGTSIPVCILVLKSKRNGNSDNILFIDASKDFIKGKNQNEISDEHIEKIVNTYIERKDRDKYAHVASMQEIIDNGYNQTIRYFKDYLVQKKTRISEIYDEILYKVRNAQGYIILGKYQNAKSTVADMFIYLSKIKDVIDEEVYNTLCEFQKLLYNNVKHGLLGYCTCNDKKHVQSVLNEIVDDLTGRIEGLNNYISKFSV